MKEFKYYQDIKMTIWGRNSFVVKANNKEEADKIVKEHRKDDIADVCDFKEDSNIIFDEWRLLEDTTEDMLVSENENNPTKEIFDWDMNEVTNNL